MGSLRLSARLHSGARLPVQCPDKNTIVRRVEYSPAVGRAELPRRETVLSNVYRKLASAPSIRYIEYSKSERSNFVQLYRDSRRSKLYHPVYLRDACTCSRCVDPSSGQKNFQTTDIPQTIKSTSVTHQEDGSVQVTWENDIPGFGTDHVSTYAPRFTSTTYTLEARRNDYSEKFRYRLWDMRRLREELQFINFEEYMNDDEKLYRALVLLKSYGIILIRGVPKSEKSVAEIAERIGTIRDTFYGRTWDVKSVPEAKNVAYTHQHLGLHMDLLYMKNPPGIQFLHCINNKCKGGESLFSDSFSAINKLGSEDKDILATENLAYHYRQPENRYYQERPLLEYEELVSLAGGRRGADAVKAIKFVNYSPPFQAKFPLSMRQQIHFARLERALRSFAKLVEDPRSVYEYRLKEGECVIFNNRRLLHGRREFSQLQESRLLKGTYVDTDVFDSRLCVLHERYKDAGIGWNYKTLTEAPEVFSFGDMSSDGKNNFVDEEARRLFLERKNLREAQAIEDEMLRS
ncbi:hypothetical protein QTJ16_006471 [Diplocarpon rosae]|uniref:Gamma-butyrobetaine dioxygenase n=1 Tax=Diplocarpon rosae TaxID=946125 RepID=A0AAD9SVW4_9HELO|nr:hypothetical protein QTJ16_006471 [Diplocarpon rosae]PBP20629.1 gamma-butyrobetaine dioxygenase [Diplocarpon rosae]